MSGKKHNLETEPWLNLVVKLQEGEKLRGPEFDLDWPCWCGVASTNTACLPSHCRTFTSSSYNFSMQILKNSHKIKQFRVLIKTINMNFWLIVAVMQGFILRIIFLCINFC